MEYEIMTKSLVVKPPTEPIYSVQATEIYLEDEAAGLFVVVEQESDRMRIEKAEWPSIRAAIDQLMEKC